MPIDAKIKDRLYSAIDAQLGGLTEIYRHLHANPELSEQEEQTGKRVASEMRALGYKVFEALGGHGVAALLENGPGPTILVRADMDALPLVETTGLPYASKVTTVDADGRKVGVMHACGHDLHTTCLIGAARVLAEMKDAFSGRVVFIGQPAEETVGGARLMMEDGLYDLVGRPDMAVALHVFPDMLAGSVGISPGMRTAFCQSIDVVIRGRGGHGAYPHKAKDPIVLSAQFVMALQTIVSREIGPAEMGVITVGAIHGGTKRNIIPGEVVLNLTIRSYDEEIGRQMTAAITRTAQGLAQSAGLPPELYPDIIEVEHPYPPVFNDPDFTSRLKTAFQDILGPEMVSEVPPSTGSEDFSFFAKAEPPVPQVMFQLGVTEQEKLDRAKQTGTKVSPVHDPKFYPNIEKGLPAGVATLAGAVLELLGKSE